MSDTIAALENDIARLLHKHATVTGREFQQACLRVAAGYYDPSDVDALFTAADFAAALVDELNEAEAD